ncbi:hypothetical protein F4820DRAFT_419772 [Hypoxylon rubiginosum]|uniref:Uncharacterized protein n=1 Tax=Hypoxylon rubiginosum TaxID=110542 RepID=A0ACB9Z1S5_9PEZI|nr:hypothetical protein F4820DRAFT_419772 [Hypoxylon rubiginosum]
MLPNTITPYERPSKNAPIIPDDLRDPNLDITTGEVRDRLVKAIPGTKTVLEPNPRYQLIFIVEELPKGRWPTSIGGLPYTMVDEGFQGRFFMLPRRQFGNLALSICETGYDVDNLSEVDLYEMTLEVINHLYMTFGPAACLAELMFTSEKAFYVALNDNFDIYAYSDLLPGKIAGCCVAYLYESEIRRAAPRHMMEPVISAGRPRIMSLVPDGARLSSSRERIRWSTCYLHGLRYKNMEGNVVMKSIRPEPRMLDGSPAECVFVVYNWTFMGQEEGSRGDDDESARERPGDSMCPVWDSDDDAILGFHDHYIAEGDWAGFAVSVSTGHIFSGYRYNSATRFSSGVMINRDLEPIGAFPRAVAPAKQVLRLPGDE